MLPSDLDHGRPTDVTVRVTDSEPDVPFEGWAVRVPGSPLSYLVRTDDASEDPGDYEPGDQLRLEDAVPYDLRVDARGRHAARSGRVCCPDCGGDVRYEPPVDLPSSVVEHLDGLVDAGPRSHRVSDRPVEIALLIAGPETTVEVAADADGRVDDWQGGLNEPRGRTVDPREVAEPGTFVCESCGHRTVEPDRRRRHETPDEAVTPDARPVASSGEHLESGVALAADAAEAAPAAPQDLGMATGGAKDVTSFRDNVAEGYAPSPEALSVEGLFYDYYFETGEDRESEDALFYPTYSAAVSSDPLSGGTEQYLSVGLNSTLSTADFERKRLDLVVVLDVSGSMSSAFDEYYYDRHGVRREVDEPGEGTKMGAAREALVALTRHLESDDRFGVVLYNNRAHTAKPLREVGRTDMDAIREHVRALEAGGGTDMSAGFREAHELLAGESDGGKDGDEGDANPTELERRIVFMTDAMPNLGETGEEGLVDLVGDAAADGIYTTFVGMGLDTNAELIDALSSTRGANHYFVHSAAEFERRLGEEFEYMVTPLVFDLSLDLVADGYEIEAVYGSPNADAATGEVMHVSTLFPSPTREGETRGGVVLLKLRKSGSDPRQPGSDPRLELVASWEERDGTEGRDAVAVTFPDDEPDAFENTGVRKAVLLARYADLLRDWAAAVRSHESEARDEPPREKPDDDADEKVDDWEPMDSPRELGEWEQESVPLVVPEEYADLFSAFREHLAAEAVAIGDADLERELDLLDDLIDAA